MRDVRAFAIGLTLCVAARPAHGALSGTITRLSLGSAEESQSAPAVSGTNVVWTGLRSPVGGSPNFDIYLLDLASGATPLNLTATPDQNEFLEDIDGPNVVWTRNSSSSAGDIVVYDATTETRQVVAAA